MAERLGLGRTCLRPEAALAASVKLAPEFKHDMELPAGVPVPVSGTAAPGSLVIVKFGKQGQKTTADAQGRWQVTLDPLRPSSKMMPLEATGEEGDAFVRIARVQAKVP